MAEPDTSDIYTRRLIHTSVQSDAYIRVSLRVYTCSPMPPYVCECCKKTFVFSKKLVMFSKNFITFLKKLGMFLM